MWWLSCCSSLEGESSSHEEDAQLHATLLQKQFQSSSNISTSAQDTFDSSQLVVLPDLAEPKSSVLPLCLHRSCTDESTMRSLVAYDEEQAPEFKHPRRLVSSEMTGV